MLIVTVQHWFPNKRDSLHSPSHHHVNRQDKLLHTVSCLMLSYNDKSYTNVMLETSFTFLGQRCNKTTAWVYPKLTVSPTVGKMSVLDLFYWRRATRCMNKAELIAQTIRFYCLSLNFTVTAENDPRNNRTFVGFIYLCNANQLPVESSRSMILMHFHCCDMYGCCKSS